MELAVAHRGSGTEVEAFLENILCSLGGLLLALKSSPCCTLLCFIILKLFLLHHIPSKWSESRSMHWHGFARRMLLQHVLVLAFILVSETSVLPYSKRLGKGISCAILGRNQTSKYSRLLSSQGRLCWVIATYRQDWCNRSTDKDRGTIWKEIEVRHLHGSGSRQARKVVCVCRIKHSMSGC